MSRLFSSSSAPTRSRLFSHNNVGEQESTGEPSKGFLENYADYAKGAGLGIAQGLGDVGSSVANFPGDIYSHFSGKESPYHVPHPTLEQYYPEGKWGHIGSTLGNIEGQVIAPGGTAYKVLKAFNNPIARALAGTAIGGGLGAATNEDDRLGSALSGAFMGGSIPAALSIGKGLTNVPWTKSIAAKPLRAAEQAFNDRNLKPIKLQKDLIKESKSFLPKNLPSKNLLDEVKKGDYKHLFTLQSDLGKTANSLMKSSSGAERLHGKQVADLRSRILNEMKQHVTKQGHSDIADMLTKGQQKYRTHMKYVAPVVNKAKSYGAHGLGLGALYEIFKK